MSKDAASAGSKTSGGAGGGGGGSTITVRLPDNTRLQVPFTASTRVWHVMGKAAKEYGCSEYEAKQWRATYPATGDLIPTNQRVVGLPEKSLIWIDAPPIGDATDRVQQHQILKGKEGPKATPRDPWEEQTTMMSVTLVLKANNSRATYADNSNSGSGSNSQSGGGGRSQVFQNIPESGMKMKVAVNVQDPASTLRQRVEAMGFTIDPTHLLCADGRVVVGEDHSFHDLRITRITLLSYVEPSTLSPQRMHRSLTNKNSSSVNKSSAHQHRPGTGSTSSTGPISPVNNAPSTNMNSSANFSQYHHQNNNNNNNSSVMAGGRGQVPPLNMSTATSTGSYNNRSYSRTGQDVGSTVRSPVSPRSQPLSKSGNVHSHYSHAASNASPRRTTLIQSPSNGIIPILFKDPEDDGYCFQIKAQQSRRVSSLLEFVSYPDEYEVRCDRELVDLNDTFLTVTRGLPGCLFTLHQILQDQPVVGSNVRVVG